MNHLQYEVSITLKHNRDGSFATRAKRKSVLFRACAQLWEKFPGLKLKNLKTKHCLFIVEAWKHHKAIKSELSHIRWLLEKLNMQYLLPKDNDSLGIPRRKIVTNENKSWIGKTDIEMKMKEIITENEIIGLALRLCLFFGLRMKEAALFRPHENIKLEEGYIEVVYGTKGSRPRRVPISTQDQIKLLMELKEKINPGKSLIPSNRSFVEFKNQFYYYVRKKGIRRSNGITTHGLRHTYANVRYAEITVTDSPVISTEKRIIDREKDQEAREIIAKELGHGRSSVTSAYTGGKR